MNEAYHRFRATVVRKYNQLLSLVHRKQCIFTDEELAEYQSYTFLSKSQIRRVYLLFYSLDADVPETNKNPFLSHDVILRLPELGLNPFGDRILEVFSYDTGVMSFEEFLEMMSVFSSKAPIKVKIEYAFRIYDFNEDDMIGPDDLRELLGRLKGRNNFSEQEFSDIVGNIMDEGDVDGDGFMSYPEFKHLLKKCPDFVHSFSMRV